MERIKMIYFNFFKAIKNEEIESNFQGIAMGDSWISPKDSVNTWSSYLYWMVSNPFKVKISYYIHWGISISLHHCASIGNLHR